MGLGDFDMAGWMLTSTLILLDVVTVIGNLLIIASVLSTPKLRTVTNCFILSLGIADFLVGLCVLPAAIAMHAAKGWWPLSHLLCHAWLSLDVLLCTASILSLCAISLDRYLAISRPFSYSKLRRSKTLAAKIIAGVWTLSILVTCPPFFGWTGLTRSVPLDGSCRYESSVGYVLFSASGSFFVPLLVILYTYSRIIVVVQTRNREFKLEADERQRLRSQLSGDEENCDKREHDEKKTSNSLKIISSEGNEITSIVISLAENACLDRSDFSSVDLRSSFDDSDLNDDEEKNDNINNTKNILAVPSVLTSRARGRSASASAAPAPVPAPVRWHLVDLSGADTGTDRIESCSICGQKSDSSLIHLSVVEDSNRPRRAMSESGPMLSNNALRTYNSKRSDESSHLMSRRIRQSYSQRHMHLREAKTAKRLAVVVLLFITCWLPFFLLYVATPFMPEKKTQEQLFLILTWLGWSNSALNPFLYASYSPTFRAAFHRLTVAKAKAIWDSFKSTPANV